MGKPIQELCDDYITKLLNNHKLTDKDKLSAILKRHNYEFNIQSLHELSCYYDSLDNQRVYEADVDYRLNNEYSITKEYNDKMAQEWANVEDKIYEE